MLTLCALLQQVSHVVPGDIVVLSTGCVVPADIRAVETNELLKVDKGLLTGESEPIR